IPLLTHMPYVVPFDTRASLFRALVSMDHAEIQSAASSSLFHGGYSRGISAKVRRSHMLEDGLVAYGKLHGADFKQDFYIQFYDDFGMREWGVDGGGLFKEFVVSIVREAFNPSNQVFWETADHLLYPNASSSARQSHSLNLYNFLGRLVGKSLYSNILIDAQFALFFLSKVLGHQSQFDDLKSLDKEIYDGLVSLKRYENDVESDFGLTFAVSSLVMNNPLNGNANQQPNTSSVVTIDLIPGGSDINVTRDNRFRYIELMCNHKLNVELSPQTRAFRQGLYEMIPQRWLRLFADPHELQMLISGKSAEIDVNDMEANTVYGNEYNRNHPVIEMFWNVVRNRLTSAERRKLVQFITSCERPPLMGFSELRPSIQIVPDHGVESANQAAAATVATAANTSRLPTASTCVNQLRLPVYTAEDVMYQKLRRAILSGAGFDLS
ncbi:HECT-domain-containing protein, partial [Ramicandelaber brevisporus]